MTTTTTSNNTSSNTTLSNSNGATTTTTVTPVVPTNHSHTSPPPSQHAMGDTMNGTTTTTNTTSPVIPSSNIDQQQEQQPQPKKRRPPRNKKKKPSNIHNTQNETITSNQSMMTSTMTIPTNTITTTTNDNPSNTTTNNITSSDISSKKSRRNRQHSKKKGVITSKQSSVSSVSNYNHQQQNNDWWIQQLPDIEMVDPITLELLSSLQYPPFPLYVSYPYSPIPIWPPISKHEYQNQKKNHNNTMIIKKNNTNKVLLLSEEERQYQILQQQWGKQLTIHQQHIDDSTTTTTKDETQNLNHHTQQQQRHIHLFDGRALAYYMVSQLQFIDPYTRRDISRDELVQLDHYLQYHGFYEIQVVQAYDEKGISISSAGAIANTSIGRNLILQQEAQILLNALFRNSTTTTNTTNNHHQTTTANTNTNNSSNQNHRHGRNRRGGGGTVTTTTSTPILNNNDTTTTTNSSYNNIMEQYMAHQEAQRQQQMNIQNSIVPSLTDDTNSNLHNHNHNNNGIYGDYNTGYMIIDDDIHPGLRGENIQNSNNNNNHSALLYSARHIIDQNNHNHHSRIPQANDFPSLQQSVQGQTTTTTTATTTPSVATINDTSADGIATSKTNNHNNNTPNVMVPLKTKTLLKISKLIQPTNIEEQQRQIEAREMARKKAIVSNLTFGVDPVIMSSDTTTSINPNEGFPTHISTTTMYNTNNNTTSQNSTGQIERNRTLAEALGVQPSTIRSGHHTTTKMGGWIRPTEHMIQMDEFGNELNRTIYPESLIKQAKEYIRPDILYKLEKKWKLFLNNDTAASLPLYPMERTVRAFVHEYASYWKLHTESFDPEPKRYIHCVKLRDTCTPYPLLSEAMHTQSKTMTVSLMNQQQQQYPVRHNTTTSDHSLKQTTGQSTTSEKREFLLENNTGRTPLSLKPRSNPIPPSIQSLGGTSISGTMNRTMDSSIPSYTNDRFQSLQSDRERPKLELQKRTVPFDVHHHHNNKSTISNPMLDMNRIHEHHIIRHEAKLRKQQERIVRQQRALADAFDDHDSDSEWEEQVPIFTGTDDE